MAVLEIVALNETTPRLIVPQVGDTYILPRATTTPVQFTSTLATGTAPLVIASTTKVDNLHVARATLGDTVTTNANLTGHVTSTGNAAILGSFTKAQLDGAVSDGNVVYTGDAVVATDPLWDAAGDIVQGTGANTAARLALGTAFQKLRVNSGATALEYFTDAVWFPIAVGDETSSLTAGTSKVTWRMPACTVLAVRGSVNTAATGATLLTIDINETGTTILSTQLTFDASEKTTTTAATPTVISDSAIADDAEMSIDIDSIGNTLPGVGLKVYLLVRWT